MKGSNLKEAPYRGRASKLRCHNNVIKFCAHKRENKKTTGNSILPQTERFDVFRQAASLEY